MRIETVGIVGAGTMGGGIAINLAQHGFQRAGCTDARPEAARAAVAVGRRLLCAGGREGPDDGHGRPPRPQAG